jgi:SNF2 family DNA or RNA helicase
MSLTGVTAKDKEKWNGNIEGITVQLLPHQVSGLSWMTQRELANEKNGARGGILADDMGLGKTLQSLSLMVTNPKPSLINDGVAKTTLIVAPLALIRQWKLEIKEKVAKSHQLRVCLYHGSQRANDIQSLEEFDVVITTYQVLVSELKASSSGTQVGCFGITWYRIILDEAHQIKNRMSRAAKACCALQSNYRWCLTGTPIQNNLNELQSLIAFLRIKPYNNISMWKAQIEQPFHNGKRDIALKRLRLYLETFMKRRTKEVLKAETTRSVDNHQESGRESIITGFKVVERRI